MEGKKTCPRHSALNELCASTNYQRTTEQIPSRQSDGSSSFVDGDGTGSDESDSSKEQRKGKGGFQIFLIEDGIILKMRYAKKKPKKFLTQHNEKIKGHTHLTHKIGRTISLSG